MKYITKEEVLQLNLTKKRGQHAENPVVTAAMKLRVGEYLLVEKKDWKIKNSIHQGIRDNSPARQARAKFLIKSLVDDKGWVIKRTA